MTLLYAAVFAEFVKIGLFAVGGGLATLPFLYDLARSRPQWLAAENLPDMLAAAQILPGAIGVNLTAYAGFNSAGVPGALLAVAGLITPQIVIIVLVARMLEAFKTNTILQAVFKALRPAACGLLAAACFGVWKQSLWLGGPFPAALRWRETLIFAVFFTAIVTLKKHPALYIACAALLGLALKL